MTKYTVYYWTNREYQIEIDAKTKEEAIKEAKEYWMDGDEISEMFDDEAGVEVEEVYDD